MPTATVVGSAQRFEHARSAFLYASRMRLTRLFRCTNRERREPIDYSLGSTSSILSTLLVGIAKT